MADRTSAEGEVVSDAVDTHARLHGLHDCSITLCCPPPPHFARPLALHRLDKAEILLRLAARKVLTADLAYRLHDVMDLAGVQLHVEGRGTCLSWRLRVKKHALTKNPDLILIEEVFTGFLSSEKEPDSILIRPSFDRLSWTPGRDLSRPSSLWAIQIAPYFAGGLKGKACGWHLVAIRQGGNQPGYFWWPSKGFCFRDSRGLR